MKDWLILALAIIVIIACLAGAPGASYDTPPSASGAGSLPTRSVLAFILHPLYQAGAALDATADWGR